MHQFRDEMACFHMGSTTKGSLMKRILITGMSATGKSSAVLELIARGYDAIDLDTPEWSEWVDAEPGDTLVPGDGKDWMWQEERVRALLSSPLDNHMFISGCAENMDQFYPLIDVVILLSAPVDTIMQRLTERSGANYGQTADERRKISELIALIEPLLRESADHEIVTGNSVRATVDEIIRLVSV